MLAKETDLSFVIHVSVGMMDSIQEKYASIKIKYASSNDKKTNQKERKNFSLLYVTKEKKS